MNDSPTRTTRSILAAGVLGGVLGGVAAFAASRMIVPALPVKTEAAGTASEAPRWSSPSLASWETILGKHWWVKR